MSQKDSKMLKKPMAQHDSTIKMTRWLKMTQDDINWQNPCKNDFEWLKILKTVKKPIVGGTDRPMNQWTDGPT